MSNFVTRVELHGANEADYRLLHIAMRARGFMNYIQADDGSFYDLPTAMYVSSSPTLSTMQVRDIALQAAALTGRAAWALTTKYEEAAWQTRKTSSLKLAI